MRRLDRNRVVRFRFGFERVPAGSVARVVKWNDDGAYDYAVQLPRGFSGHKLYGALKTDTGYFVNRDVLESTRVKVSGAKEFNRRYKFTPVVEGAYAKKA